MQPVTLTLPMITDMELTASHTAGALGRQIGMASDQIDEIKQAVVEACINAFEHSGAIRREVVVQLDVLGTDDAPEGMRISVRDFGTGFNLDRARNPRGERLVDLKRGHGLRIIEGLMDEIHIESDGGGTTVVMTKLR
ncbi:MAG: ATP-binding protein [Acidobacteriota bacterium]